MVNVKIETVIITKKVVKTKLSEKQLPDFLKISDVIEFST